LKIQFQQLPWKYFFLHSFGLTQKNQKVKTQQSSSRTRPDAGPLLCRPTRLSDLSFVVKKGIQNKNPISSSLLIHRKDAEDAKNNDWFKSSDLPAAGRLGPPVCSLQTAFS
jgi:hypothetical protein